MAEGQGDLASIVSLRAKGPDLGVVALNSVTILYTLSQFAIQQNFEQIPNPCCHFRTHSLRFDGGEGFLVPQHQGGWVRRPPWESWVIPGEEIKSKLN